MDSFFSSIVKTKFNNREYSIKQTLIETLSDNAKEIQYELKESGSDGMRVEQLDLCDHTQSLCATIEAIFLHGLKDSFLWQTISLLAGTSAETNRRPAPTFWPPLLIFSHKYAIEQIHSMNQITTEIGYCRCWIRQSLNDCLLSSYISNMRKNTQALSPYYQRTAFVCDPDSMELAESLIGGIEACVSFQLPLNSSLLNQWTDLPLQLSGLYTPALQSCPIASGIDVANSGILSTSVSPAKIAIDQTATELLIGHTIAIPKPLQTNEFFAESIHNSPFKESAMIQRKNPFMKPYIDVEEIEEVANVDMGVDCNATIDDDIEHDVQLTALLSRVDAMATGVSEEPLNSKGGNEQAENYLVDDSEKKPTLAEVDKLIEVTSYDALAQQLPENISPSMGNSLIAKMGWSSTDENNAEQPKCHPNYDQSISIQSTTTTLSRSNSLNNSTARSPIDRHSYNSLLRRGNKGVDGLYTRKVDFNDVWIRFESSLGISSASAEIDNKVELDENADVQTQNDEIDDDGLLDFEFVQAECMSTKFTLVELQEMVRQTFKIPHELGLDAQNFACLACGNPLGVGGSGHIKTQVCGFNGSYYCSSCMATDLQQIPARVIFNWDFRKLPVSQKAAAFLQEFQYQPFIDLKLLNPDIYQYVDEMAELQSLRIQLNFIRAYLFTCCAPIIEKLRKQLWTKEYLCEHIHRYTLADLQIIPKHVLADQLRKVVSFGRQHILECSLCSQKGFICEICQSNKVLYPFDIDTTYKCDDCGAVFHAECLNEMYPCPKCERKRKRGHLNIVDDVHQTTDGVEELASEEI